VITCPNCGTENPERAKFCLECASPLGSASARQAGTRKLVTVLFADVVGSTALGERLANRLIAQARDIAESTDFLWLRGAVFRAEARIAEIAGQRDKALERYRAALNEYEQRATSWTRLGCARRSPA
jgi:hypothetical protein